jgi:hypothetical protein
VEPHIVLEVSNWCQQHSRAGNYISVSHGVIIDADEASKLRAR